MEIFIDPGDPRGLAGQLYAQVCDAILDGRLRAGDALTPSRELARQLGISRFTVTEAYARLAAEGYVDGRGRGGTVVTSTVTATERERPATALRPTATAASIRRFDRDPTARARFDLRPGTIDAGLFSAPAWRRCMAQAMQEAPPHYGDPAGSPALREALARWIGRSRGVLATAADVVVTSGALHAVDLVARVLIEPGDVVAIEDPGYPPAYELLRSLGARTVGVPLDEHGLIVDAIPAEARLIYVTPSHQFPLGVVLSHERRIQLLRWAARHGAAVIEDDYDSQYRYDSRPLEPLQRLDRDGRVIYVGTMSKVLSPSLRIGFAVVPRSITDAVHTMRQTIDWCPPWPTDGALANFITEGHLARHVVRATRHYRERRRAVREAVRSLSVPIEVMPSTAGLHLALVLDGPVGDDDDRRLQRAARDHEVLADSLRRCYRSAPPRIGLLVGFGALPADSVDAAMSALDLALLDFFQR
jgi:GntR family transcriptional regulator/MocR family aminotransferase